MNHLSSSRFPNSGFQSRTELLINRKEEFKREAIKSGGPERLMTRSTHSLGNFRRVSKFSKGEEGRIDAAVESICINTTNNRPTNHATTENKNTTNSPPITTPWGIPRESENKISASISPHVKQLHDRLYPSAIVEKRIHDNLLAEKVNYPPNGEYSRSMGKAYSNGGEAVFTRIPLWKIPYFVNERSQLESTDIPMYSSLSKDKIFRPHSAKNLSSRVLRQKKEEFFDPALFWHPPALPSSVVQRALNFDDSTNNNNDSTEDGILHDADERTSCYSGDSHFSARSARSDVSSSSNITATIVSKKKTNSRPSTPRTWSPMTIVQTTDNSTKIIDNGMENTPRSSIGTKRQQQPLNYPRRPQSAGATRVRFNQTLPPKNTSITSGRPLSARIRRNV